MDWNVAVTNTPGPILDGRWCALFIDDGEGDMYYSTGRWDDTARCWSLGKEDVRIWQVGEKTVKMWCVLPPVKNFGKTLAQIDALEAGK